MSRDCSIGETPEDRFFGKEKIRKCGFCDFSLCHQPFFLTFPRTLVDWRTFPARPFGGSSNAFATERRRLSLMLKRSLRQHFQILMWRAGAPETRWSR